jgi:putative peptidoglycan lipid II flippase
VKFGIITMVANMVFNLILAVPFGYVGLAMATALSGTLNAILLYRELHKQGVYKVSRSSLYFVFKVFLAALVMGGGIVFYAIELNLHESWLKIELIARLIDLSSMIAIGLFLYILSLLILGLRLKDFKNNNTP